MAMDLKSATKVAANFSSSSKGDSTFNSRPSRANDSASGRAGPKRRGDGNSGAVEPRYSHTTAAGGGGGGWGRRGTQSWTGPQHSNGQSSHVHKKQGTGRYGPMDRRPRERDVDESSKTQEVKGVGGKSKKNLTHLVNFSFSDHRDEWDLGDYGGGGGGGRTHQYNSHRRGQRGRLTKEQYLQAVAQFVVSPWGDYSSHCANADLPVDWELIEQVRVPVREMESPSCPICLYPPTVARITRCGHIYCWACILHYLSLAEGRKGAACPVCSNTVTEGTLKSVVSLPRAQICIDTKVTMKLIKRERGSTHGVPMSQWSDRKGELCAVEDAAVDTSFLKLVQASVSEVNNLLSADREALHEQLQAEEKGSLESTYIQAAITSVQAKLKSLEEKSKIMESMSIKATSSFANSVAPNQSNASTYHHGSPTNQSNASTCHHGSLANQSAVCTQPAKPSSSTWDPWEDTAAESACCELKADSAVVDDNTEANEDGVGNVEDDCHSNHGKEESDSVSGSSPAMDRHINAVDTSLVTAEGQVGTVNMGQSSELGQETGVLQQETDVVVPGLKVTDPTPEERMRRRRGRGNVVPTDVYYYYQSTDGQPVFLHSVNARCLAAEWGGSLEGAPEEITATVVAVEYKTMDEDLRKCMKYISHLPLHCEFTVVELELKPPNVSSQVLYKFSAELDRRRKQRQKKTRQDARDQKKMEAKTNKLMGQYSSNSMRITPSAAPQHSMNRQQPATANSGNRNYTLSTSSSASSGEGATGGSGAGQREGAITPDTKTFVSLSMAVDPPRKPQTTPYSFSRMVQDGKAKAIDPWPVHPGAARPPITDSSIRGVSGGAHKGRGNASDDDEECCPPPSYQDSFAADLSRCLGEALAKGEKKDGADGENNTGSSGGGKKKKKKQRTVLFTSWGSRAD